MTPRPSRGAESSKEMPGAARKIPLTSTLRERSRWPLFAVLGDEHGLEVPGRPRLSYLSIQHRDIILATFDENSPPRRQIA